jgi:hypothetical protein
MTRHTGDPMRSLAMLALAALFLFACADDEEPETCRAFIFLLCSDNANVCSQYVDDCVLTDEPGVCEYRGDLVLCEGAAVE